MVAVEGVTCSGEMGVVLWLLYGHECCLWWGGLSCNLGLFGCRWALGGEYGGGAAEASVQRMRSMEVEIHEYETETETHCQHEKKKGGGGLQVITGEEEKARK